MPFISIITITYNAQDFLERTLQSIRGQTSSDFEYILIDGGSKDGTMGIVEANKDLFAVIVSEKDEGLYDAMNKGLEKATGEYVWFMNAGDEIAEFDAIKKLKMLILKKPDIIYSDTFIVDDSGKMIGLRTEITPHEIPQNLTWNDYKMGMLVCYIENNLSADIDWEIKCLKASKSSMPYPGILAKYLEGGTSHQQLFKSWKDRYGVLRTHFGFFPNLWNHFRIILRADVFAIFRISKYIK
jgi:glycosyltransferase involved in cell wall biosynthesis